MTGDERSVRGRVGFFTVARCFAKKLPICLALIAMALLSGAMTVAAQEQVFSDQNCAITPPADWLLTTNRVTNQIGTLSVSFVAPGRKRFLMLIMQKNRHVPLNDFFVSSYERAALRQGGSKPISTRFMEIDGIKAYERIADRVIKGRTASTIRHLVLTDTGIYTVEGMRYEGSVTNDSEILDGLNSFHFITQPQVPALSGRSEAFRVGYMMVRYIPVVTLGIAVFVFVIVLIGRIASGGSRSKPPPLPPMPPPL